MPSTTAFVTGSNGFIAQHLVNHLLEKGYFVVGTVRSTDKGDALVKYFGDKFSYEIVRDLEDEGTFEKALAKHPEITIVFHTASPIVYNAKDLQKDVIDPAVRGTVNILRAIKTTSPQVKKVIVTSSGLTIMDSNNPKASVNEDSWNTVTLKQALENPVTAYTASKKFAEKAAWEFVKNEKPTFDFTTVHPLFVLGPQLQDKSAKGSLNATNAILTDLLNLKQDEPVPIKPARFVNVKDVAKAHVIAAEKDASGERIVVHQGKFDPQTALDIIHRDIPELSERFVKGKPGQGIENATTLDDSKSREFLQIDYIDLKETIASTVKQYLTVNSL